MKSKAAAKDVEGHERAYVFLSTTVDKSAEPLIRYRVKKMGVTRAEYVRRCVEADLKRV